MGSFVLKASAYSKTLLSVFFLIKEYSYKITSPESRDARLMVSLSKRVALIISNSVVFIVINVGINGVPSVHALSLHEIFSADGHGVLHGDVPWHVRGASGYYAYSPWCYDRS